MDLDLAHRRYTQQAAWTAPLRRHIFTRAGLPNAHRILEVGCGTGAVLSTVPLTPKAAAHGLDIDPKALAVAKTHSPQISLSVGDAHALPFGDGMFDICFFHYVLLWLRDPIVALAEAHRITRPGGAVIAFAEPDYTQRQDAPEAMAALGRLQTEALRSQGADVSIGSRLPDVFQAAGLRVVESGQLQPPTDPQPLDPLELEVLRADLANLAGSGSQGFSRLLGDIEQQQLENIKSHVPTYFCWATVP